MMTCCFIAGHAQSAIKQIFERLDNKLYVVEKESKFEVVPDVITVKMKEGVPPAEGLEFSKRGYAKIAVPDGVDVEAFAKELDETGLYEYIILNTKVHYHMAFNDNTSATLWHLSRIKATDAWDITTGNPSIKMAIIDSGISAEHFDLGPTTNYNYSHVSTSLGWDYVNNMSYYSPSVENHGTMVAGVAGAKTNNGMGAAGVCGGNGNQGITMIPYRLNSTADIADAIDRAVLQGAKVINISIGPSYSQEIEEALEDAFNSYVTIVCSTGNNGNGYVEYPASSWYTIGVGASTKNNLKLSSSQYGVGTDLVAPGDSIYTTDLGNQYCLISGTSFAAPQVASTVALMLSVNPDLTPLQIREILRNTATKIGTSTYSYNNAGWCMQVGYGLLNTYKAVLSALAPTLEINGASELCGSEVYSINNLPNGSTVGWSFQNTNSSANSLIQGNYPAQNQCIINIENNENIDETLVATVYHNSNLVATLTKDVTTNWNFAGTYSIVCSSPLYNNVTNAPFGNNWNVAVWPNSDVTINSENFPDVTLSHTLSSKISWSYDNDETIQLHVSSLATDGHTMTVTGTANSDCDNFKFYVVVRVRLSDPLLNMNPNRQLSISLHEEDVDYFKSSGMNWNVTIKNIATGQTVFKGNTKNPLITINAESWPSGFYSVQHTLGEQIITQKLMVK